MKVTKVRIVTKYHMCVTGDSYIISTCCYQYLFLGYNNIMVKHIDYLLTASQRGYSSNNTVIPPADYCNTIKMSRISKKLTTDILISALEVFT